MEKRSKSSSLSWGVVLLLCTILACMGKTQETNRPKAFQIVKTVSLKTDSSLAKEPMFGKEQAQVDIKLSVSNLTPDVNEPITIRLEYTPHVDAPNSRVKFDLIPSWVEILSGDTLWTGDVKQGETVVGEIVIKPTLQEVFLVTGEGGFTPGGGKSESVKIHVKGAVEVPQRILSVRTWIDKLQAHLADIKSGKLSKDEARRIYREPRWAVHMPPGGKEKSTAQPSQEDSLYYALQDAGEKLTEEIYELLYPKVKVFRVVPLNSNDSTRSKKD